MKHLVLTAALLGVAATLTAQPLSLGQAVAEALERNPMMVSAEASVEMAEARAAQAQSAWLPRIDATATSTQSDHPVFVFGSLLEQGRFGQQHFDPAFLNDPDSLRNDRLAVNVRYTFFDQFRRLNATRQTRNAVAGSKHGAEELRQQTIVSVLRAYYGIALADERRAATAAAVKAAEAEVAAIRDKLSEGLIVESDLLATEVQLAEFRQQLVDAEGGAAIARAALATLLQRPIHEPIEISAQLGSTNFAAITLDEAAKRGAGRSDLAAAKAALENAHLDLQTARGSFLPRLDGIASFGASGSTFTASGADHTFALVASLDLFDGAKFARVAEARAGREAARAAEAAARDRVTMEIVTAWHRLQSAEARVALAAKAASQAASAAQIIRDRYDNGLTTISEQLRADTAVLRAQLDLLAASHDRIIGQAELLRATGGLHEVESFL
ncbi:MAG: TolC family protein [Thermoanaerobaculia bacterium]